MAYSKFNTKQFENHVDSFMDSMQLHSPDKSIVVAVSGGVDSIALMYVLHRIMPNKSRSIRVLHINHGTRIENADEEKLVLKHCQQLGVEVDIVKFKLNVKLSNFESIARNLRAKVYKQYLEKNFWVYTAHHLDDSFEWSMIQSFKQSIVTSTLGIPVFNQGLVRPFMCVSKKHLRKYARALGLSWAEDSSNRDIRFERNFFRQTLTETIQKRYPQYLHHYVARQNQLAMTLGKHRSLFVKKMNSKKRARLFEKRETSGAVVLKSDDFSFYKDQIKEWIHFFSRTGRGEINLEVDKLITAHRKIIQDQRSLKMKGPLSFSGGVKIFILGEYLLISNDSHLDFYLDCDQRLLKWLQSSHENDTQITFAQSTDAKKAFFPYISFLDEKDRSKSSKLIHPLLPKSTQWLKDKKIPYSFYPLLSRKNRQKLVRTAVILDSSILG